MKLFNQLLPIILTIVTFIGLAVILFFFLHLLNLFPIKTKISLFLNPADILVGLVIYLKTSIDFAIFIGNLMHKYPGIKNRIAIELGTALGNGVGTLIILTIWTFFKEAPLLLFFMIITASLVLFRLSGDSLKEFFESKKIHLPKFLETFFVSFYNLLSAINSFFAPVISLIIPRFSTAEKKALSFRKLFTFSFSIPFILGLDDFAGYIPLFSIINIFGFAIGVFLGHMILNISLFSSPTFTTKIVKQPFAMILGSLIFIGLSLWGFIEAFHMFF